MSDLHVASCRHDMLETQEVSWKSGVAVGSPFCDIDLCGFFADLKHEKRFILRPKKKQGTGNVHGMNFKLSLSSTNLFLWELAFDLTKTLPAFWRTSLRRFRGFLCRISPNKKAAKWSDSCVHISSECVRSGVNHYHSVDG